MAKYSSTIVIGEAKELLKKMEEEKPRVCLEDSIEEIIDTLNHHRKLFGELALMFLEQDLRIEALEDEVLDDDE